MIAGKIAYTPLEDAVRRTAPGQRTLYELARMMEV